MEWRVALCAIMTLLIHTNTYTQIVELTPKQEYTFNVASSFKRAPVTVHEQNKDFVAVSCRNTTGVEVNATHTCTLSVIESAPKDSTFAIFQKETSAPDSILFHISVKGE